MNKKRILIDVDGIFAKYVEYYLTYINSVFDTDYKYEQITDFAIEESINLSELGKYLTDRWKTQHGLAQNFDIDQDVADTIILLDAVADVYFLTAHLSSNPTWVYDRDRWLRKNFGDTLGKKVIYTHHKYIVGGDIFIDDCYDNIVKWKQYNPKGLALLWNAPWNEKYNWDKRIDSKDFKRLQEELLGGF